MLTSSQRTRPFFPSSFIIITTVAISCSVSGFPQQPSINYCINSQCNHQWKLGQAFHQTSIDTSKKVSYTKSAPIPFTSRTIPSSQHSRPRQQIRRDQSLFGWLDNFLPKIDDYDEEKEIAKRKQQYPEQYPATYDLLNNDDPPLTTDDSEEKIWIRSLLKQTQLEMRAIQLVYDADVNGWTPEQFHGAVDGKGASIVVAEVSAGNEDDVRRNKSIDPPQIVGGYNPKGWASLGGARPSIASFLFYSTPLVLENVLQNDDDDDDGTISNAMNLNPTRIKQQTFRKLQKVGGGGLACARDDPSFGISFGPDSLVIGLQPGRERLAQSKLGSYFEKGKDELGSLFDVRGGGSGGGVCYLKSLKVYAGVYEEGEESPYSGGVLDMTSG